MNRRQFLQLSSASALLAGCDTGSWLAAIPPWLPVSVLKPAMREGHYLRQLKQLPRSLGTRKVDTVIIGSGIAGLTAAWRLKQQGYDNFVLLMGGEPFGNASGGTWNGVNYPRGAHYLPLPTLESTHIRELLFDLGVIEAEPFSLQPSYDERATLHAPNERLWVDGVWQDSIMPRPASPQAQAQFLQFAQFTQWLRQQRGNDGKPLFAIPLIASSQDPQWRNLDKVSFAQWLTQQGFTDSSLRWYLDYCYRDDFGLNSPLISAWAGLHYFASRTGQGRNIAPQSEAVLTWPQGLQYLAQKMLPKTAQQQQGFALHINEHQQGVDVLYSTDIGRNAFTLQAKRVICAMPLHVTARLFPQIKDYGFEPQHIPPHAPWLVSNVYLDRFPQEANNSTLAWDNVVYGSQSLGYVVATHQQIRAAKPPYTVFTSYHALAEHLPIDGRKWLQSASTAELMALGLHDLQQVYGSQLWRCARGVELTLRGHAMPSPTVGFLNNKGLQALQAADGKVLFAHSDLSSYSIFEEAAWWGWQAANRLTQA
ncbi:MAG: FAD-dependent oxidoreductase [Moraxellaceae bacterium]|nr:FAD-dependent oxidoreductase [Moraxellaceae bacterium]